jgi:hypothetical protein
MNFGFIEVRWNSVPNGFISHVGKFNYSACLFQEQLVQQQRIPNPAAEFGRAKQTHRVSV